MIPAVPDPPQEVEYGVEPVEYSNNFDEQGAVDAASNPTGGHGPADPGQTLYTEPPDGPTASDQNPSDGTDFVPGLESGTEPDSQIDALAYGDDAGLDALLADETELLVSVVADGNAEEVAVFIEDATGALQIHYTHESLNHVDPAGELDDLDALELWGPVGQADADYYSLQGDAVTGTSVYLYFGGTVLTFVEWADIVTAVQSLGYEGDPNAVDVDALMVGDQNDRETFADGDLIVFSIRGVPGSGFDGGEIIVLQSGQPPYFLMHSGNTWNPAFDVTSAVTNALGGVDPGAGGEDVDAIEAIAEPTAAVPVLGVLGLMALAASLLATGGLLRKK
jgi:hypothetical protein